MNYDKNGALCQENQNCSSKTIKHKINQTLWPDHCIMDTKGANLSTQLIRKKSDILVRKGYKCEVSILPVLTPITSKEAVFIGLQGFKVAFILYKVSYD